MALAQWQTLDLYITSRICLIIVALQAQLIKLHGYVFEFEMVKVEVIDPFMCFW